MGLMVCLIAYLGLVLVLFLEAVFCIVKINATSVIVSARTTMCLFDTLHDHKFNLVGFELASDAL